ncbi:hypothetical protein [Halorubrum sp. AS12]
MSDGDDRDGDADASTSNRRASEPTMTTLQHTTLQHATRRLRNRTRATR